MKANTLIAVYFFTAILFTLFLGYIDEGYYNFNFIKDPGVLLVLGLYTLVLWTCVILVDAVLIRVKPTIHIYARILIAVPFGLLTPIALLLLVAA